MNNLAKSVLGAVGDVASKTKDAFTYPEVQSLSSLKDGLDFFSKLPQQTIEEVSKIAPYIGLNSDSVNASIKTLREGGTLTPGQAAELSAVGSRAVRAYKNMTMRKFDTAAMNRANLRDSMLWGASAVALLGLTAIANRHNRKLIDFFTDDGKSSDAKKVMPSDNFSSKAQKVFPVSSKISPANGGRSL